MATHSVQTKRFMMTKYDIYVFCNDCSDCHNMGIQVLLNDGPTEIQSIENLYAGKKVPSHIGMFMNNYVRCLYTGRLFAQKNNKQIFLVPVHR